MAQIKSQIEDEAEGCFTSMIDVVFLLLIFFICQPFKEPDRRILAYLPKDVGGGSASNDIKPTIQLGVMGEGNRVTFTIDDREVRPDYIAPNLMRKSGGDKEVPVAIDPGPQVNFQHVLKALDQCAIAEMQNVTFAVKW
jgi:biopolymer transport protein ExbD